MPFFRPFYHAVLAVKTRFAFGLDCCAFRVCLWAVGNPARAFNRGLYPKSAENLPVQGKDE